MKAWKYCSKCRKPVTLDYLPSYRTINEELDKLEREHQVHLCSTCPKEFATCKAQNITFGNCVGNDNVVYCNLYTEVMIGELIEEYGCNPSDYNLSAITKDIITLVHQGINRQQAVSGKYPPAQLMEVK